MDTTTHAQTARDSADATPTPTTSSDRPATAPPLRALAVHDVRKSFGSTQAVDGITLSVHPGEVVALLGRNGAGKTTLIDMVLGLQQPDSGTTSLFGMSPRAAIRRSLVGVVHQTGALLPNFTVEQTLRVFAGAHSHPLPVDRVLEETDLAGLARRPVVKLSGGEQQRVRMAQALAGDPALLLCDEPLLSLDVRRQAEIIDLIDSQRARRGFAVLMVTHDVNPVIDYIDRVMYVANGRIRVGTTDEVMRSDVLSELYGSEVDVIRQDGRVFVAGAPEHRHHPAPTTTATWK